MRVYNTDRNSTGLLKAMIYTSQKTGQYIHFFSTIRICSFPAYEQYILCVYAKEK